MNRQTAGLLVVGVAVVLAGCGGILGDDRREVPDGYGEVAGVEYDDDIDVTVEDGLTEAELGRLVNRTMARIEAIRELNYDRPVAVEIIDRQEYRTRYGGQFTRGDGTWENQIWRALFLIGQDRDATAALDEAFGQSVQGFYSAGRDEIVIVSDSKRPTVSMDTLVHELTHALQDQRYGLEFGQPTRDQQAAYDTLVEGEADLVAHLYLTEWCEQWDCLRPGGGDGGAEAPAEEIALLVGQPYRAGPTYVQQLRAEGGWEAVNEAHQNPPLTTAAIIDDDGAEKPTEVRIPDRSTAAWERFDHEPVGDTVGAASIYAMLAANGVVDNDDPRSYVSPAVEGWTGDRIVPYKSAGAVGYVWELTWEDGTEAKEFADAFRQVLDRSGALARGRSDYVIEAGSFEGAYRVTVEGNRVEIVGGPDREALDEIHG